MKIYILLLLIVLSSCGVLDLSYNETNTWPDNTIVYSIDKNVPQETVSLILKAMEIWEAKTVIKFIKVEKTTLSYHIYMDDSISYSSTSTVGFNYKNFMRIKNTSLNLMLHELGHCIGLSHEHQRLDRDRYIEIIWENIDENIKGSFVKKKSFIEKLNSIYENKPYDYNSIMHYKNSYRGKKIINGKKPIIINGLTELDILTVNQLYN